MTTDELLANTALSFDSAAESNTIARASYDPEGLTMEVAFKGPVGTKTYFYAGIPAELWIEFEMASSKGKFFAERIRPMFAGKKL